MSEQVTISSFTEERLGVLSRHWNCTYEQAVAACVSLLFQMECEGHYEFGCGVIRITDLDPPVVHVLQ